MEKKELVLNPRQKAFVKKCEKEGLEIDMSYSGRGMFGRRCPAVRLDSLAEFPGNPHTYSTDQMGLGVVVYCP